MTTTNDIALASIEDVAKQIASKEISPVELTETMLRRIERLNPQLNVYITVTADDALEEARVAQKEIGAGKHRGPLHGVPIAVKDHVDAGRQRGRVHEIARGEYRGLLQGVPIAIKDLFATKGVRTTAGSKLLSDWVPEEDATVVTKLRDAGAISLGKLGMHEWAYGTTSANVHYGYVRNPWDVERIPGGSSGGSGAATAAGLAYATLGSDTGGSIRVPASFCGCVGMMPTYGRASLHGAVPLAGSLDHPGPLTRTVRDAAIVLQGMSGYDERDPATDRVPVPNWLANIERGPKGLRIGVPKQHFWENLDPEVELSIRAAIDALREAGADVRHVDWPEAVTYSNVVGAIIITEAAAYHAPNFPSRRDDYGEQVATMLDLGLQVKATSYVQAMRVMQDARRGAADRALEDVHQRSARRRKRGATHRVQFSDRSHGSACDVDPVRADVCKTSYSFADYWQTLGRNVCTMGRSSVRAGARPVPRPAPRPEYLDRQRAGAVIPHHLASPCVTYARRNAQQEAFACPFER